MNQGFACVTDFLIHGRCTFSFTKQDLTLKCSILKEFSSNLHLQPNKEKPSLKTFD